MYSFYRHECPTMEVEIADGKVLHVLPASKRIFEKMQSMERDLDSIFEMTVEILKNNRERVSVTREEVEALPLSAVTGFYRAYLAFMRGEVEENPN